MRNVDLFDDYLTGRMQAADVAAFESRLKSDSEFAEEFSLHKLFIESIVYAENKNALKKSMEAAHDEAFGTPNVVALKPAVNYWKVAAVAAGVAAFIFINGSIIFRSAFMTKESKVITDLANIMDKASEEATNHFKSKNSDRVYAPANIEATGFSISTKGYFLTSLHSVKSADSVMVKNDELDFVPAERVWEDAKLDVAIYKLKDVSRSKEVSIAFRTSDLDLGEKVFALGYPRESVVYAEGNISAESGLQGDTTKYQLSLMVNPGNSGSPVLDEKGNLVGLIASRNDNAQGVSYAVKAKYIYDMIKAIPDEKLRNEILLNGKNSVKGLKRTEQIKKIKPYVYNIMIYNSHLSQQ